MSEIEGEAAEAAPATDALSHATIEAVLAAVEAGDHPALVALLEPLHEADVADLLEQISRPERQALGPGPAIFVFAGLMLGDAPLLRHGTRSNSR